MKYEITKGSEKDFEGYNDDIITIYRINGIGHFHYSVQPASKLSGCSLGHLVDIIAERRLVTEWDGTGLPPVGVECEFDWSGEGFNVGIVRYISKQTVIIECAQVENSYGIEDLTFRPIRSPDEVARDEVIANICFEIGVRPNNIVVQQTYDAIAAGKIKGVVLDSSTADLKINITTDEMWREFEKKSDMRDVQKLMIERASRRSRF